MYLPWFMLTTALGMQPLGLAHIISFLVGSLDSCRCRIWFAEGNQKGSLGERVGG